MTSIADAAAYFELKALIERIIAERDALATVVEQVEELSGRSSTYGPDEFGDFKRKLRDILSTAPATVLAQVKADAWDEGAEAVIQHGAHITWEGSGPVNPYRDA